MARALDEALPVYLALVVGLALVLLVLVFRSLLVPLVGVLGFLLTIGASLGATVAVFQWGWLADVVNLDGTGPLISLTPILVIGILFGLAMDYQIFLVSRMHEAHSSGAAPLQAIRPGRPPLLGGRAWWLPRWLRWLPVLDVERAALEKAGPVPVRDELAAAGAR